MSLTKARFSMIDGLSVNVKDFGAIGDGQTDDTAAINAAFSHVVNSGSGEIFFPSGHYLITDTVGVPSGQNQDLHVSVIGEPEVLINCNPDTGISFAISLASNNIKTAIVRNIKINNNNKTSIGIGIISTEGAIDTAIVDNCQVEDSFAAAGASAGARPIRIASNTAGGIASVTNCHVKNVSREETGLACQAIFVQSMQNVSVNNNVVENVTHSNIQGDKRDADGIVVFGYVGSGARDKSVAIISGNTIKECAGRFVKTQVAGQCTIENNLMILESSIQLITGFVGVACQAAEGTIINNKILIGDQYVINQSTRVFDIRHPFVGETNFPREAFYKNVIKNYVSIKKQFNYGCLLDAPDTGLNAKVYVNIKDNIFDFAGKSYSADFDDSAVDRFLACLSAPAPADFDSEWIWTIANNNVSADQFITLSFSQGDYTDKWYWYIYGNVGNTRRSILSVERKDSPFTYNVMVKDNSLAERNIYGAPFDASKIIDGSDFGTGDSNDGDGLNMPPNYKLGRIYKKGGVLGVQTVISGVPYFYISTDEGSNWYEV